MAAPSEKAPPSAEALKSQHAGMRRRVDHLTATFGPGVHRVQAVALSNHLAEAFAWIQAADLLHAESVLTDLEPKLARLEATGEASRESHLSSGADPSTPI